MLLRHPQQQMVPSVYVMVGLVLEGCERSPKQTRKQANSPQHSQGRYVCNLQLQILREDAI